VDAELLDGDDRDDDDDDDDDEILVVSQRHSCILHAGNWAPSRVMRI